LAMRHETLTGKLTYINPVTQSQFDLDLAAGGRSFWNRKGPLAVVAFKRPLRPSTQLVIEFQSIPPRLFFGCDQIERFQDVKSRCRHDDEKIKVGIVTSVPQLFRN